LHYVKSRNSKLGFDNKKFIEEREQRYKQKSSFILQMSEKKLLELPYFSSWLCGFIEAEGCFSFKNINNPDKQTTFSFSISQKGDAYLLYAIRDFLQSSNKVRTLKNDVYLLEVYKKSCLKILENLFVKYPLLGEKNVSMQKFFHILNNNYYTREYKRKSPEYTKKQEK
jgi:hypothetical protein